MRNLENLNEIPIGYNEKHGYRLTLVKSEHNDKFFKKLYKQLLDEHQTYANKLGLIDPIIENYDLLKLDRTNNKNIMNYKIKMIDGLQWAYVGVLRIEIMYTDIYNPGHLYCYIHGLKVATETHQGVATMILDSLKEIFGAIELECWYDMPANYLYNKLGKKLYTRYRID